MTPPRLVQRKHPTAEIREVKFHEIFSTKNLREITEIHLEKNMKKIHIGNSRPFLPGVFVVDMFFFLGVELKVRTFLELEMFAKHFQRKILGIVYAIRSLSRWWFHLIIWGNEIFADGLKPPTVILK